MVEFNPPPGRAMESVAGRYRQLPTLLAGFRGDTIHRSPDSRAIGAWHCWR